MQYLVRWGASGITSRTSLTGCHLKRGQAIGRNFPIDLPFKHHRPDRSSASVSVSTDIVPIGSGWGQMRYGEGKYGGAEQVIITTKNGDKRALSSVLQNVFDAWITFLGQPLAAIGHY
jgi:hypothetical protein